MRFVLLGMSWGRGGFLVGLLSLGHGGGAETYLAGITQLPPDRERERERGETCSVNQWKGENNEVIVGQ